MSLLGRDKPISSPAVPPAPPPRARHPGLSTGVTGVAPAEMGPGTQGKEGRPQQLHVGNLGRACMQAAETPPARLHSQPTDAVQALGQNAGPLPTRPEFSHNKTREVNASACCQRTDTEQGPT